MDLGYTKVCEMIYAHSNCYLFLLNVFDQTASDTVLATNGGFIAKHIHL